MRMLLTLAALLSAGTILNGCCPLSCLIAGSKGSTPTKQVTPTTKAAKGDKAPAGAGQKSEE